jgi:hypothetical protein
MTFCDSTLIGIQSPPNVPRNVLLAVSRCELKQFVYAALKRCCASVGEGCVTDSGELDLLQGRSDEIFEKPLMVSSKIMVV